MAGIPPVLLGLWALSIIAQLAVFTLLLAKGYSRTLPLFSTYIALNLCQAGLLIIVYSRVAFDSHQARVVFWFSEGITLVAKAFAATELLRHVLRPYRGIWALGWRLLAIASLLVVSYAVASAGQDLDWRLMIADRGYHLTFAVAFVSCLLLVRFYAIPVHPVYKALLAGFCFFSCAVIATNTLLPILLARHVTNYSEIWNSLHLAIFTGVQVTWVVALRKPLSALDERPALLPASAYGRLSPEINMRLHLLNELLRKFWRVEAPRP